MITTTNIRGLPWWLSGKESTCQPWDSIPGLGRSPGEGSGQPAPVFLPGEPHRVWQATVHGVTKSQT